MLPREVRGTGRRDRAASGIGISREAGTRATHPQPAAPMRAAPDGRRGSGECRPPRARTAPCFPGAGSAYLSSRTPPGGRRDVAPRTSSHPTIFHVPIGIRDGARPRNPRRLPERALRARPEGSPTLLIVAHIGARRWGGAERAIALLLAGLRG